MAEHRKPATPPRMASGTLPYLGDFLSFLRVLYRHSRIKNFPTSHSLAVRDCGTWHRLQNQPSCVVRFHRLYWSCRAVPSFYRVIGEFIFIVDYVTARFHRPGVVAPVIVQSTIDFNLLALWNVCRWRYSFCFGMKNLHSSLRSVVFFLPRPNIFLSRPTSLGCQASETDGDIQIKKCRNDENEQPHK